MTGENEDLIAGMIGDAEAIHDPLDGLIEKAATDRGAALQPEIVKSLVALKNTDPAGFETLRAQLKAGGCRVTVLDDAMATESGDGGGRGPTQADLLVRLALCADLFHTPDKKGYADLDIDGHRETWQIRSTGFRRWLTHRFFEDTGGAANSDAIQSALNVIEAKADFDAPERAAYVRVGGFDEKIYLDLCNHSWQVVEIDDQGWRIVNASPVRFRRAAGMKPLPAPVSGGSIKELERFFNVKSQHDFVLLVAFLLAALRPCGPYPMIAVSGEQGSAKSTLIAILKALLDPNTASLRALPREDRDLFIAANNGYVLAFDNVSGLSPWISDTLCRLSTGGSFAVRQLYSDQEETLFEATRPVMLNGIEEVVTRPDLADRAIFLMLQSIPDDRRRPERELWADFDQAHPRILGALFDAVALGLAMLPQTKLEKHPRMADFALWATACETAIWPRGTFEAAYNGNRNQVVENVLESDTVAVALRTFVAGHVEWEGTATELLAALGNEAPESQKRSKEWPTSGRALSGRLRRAATFLRKVGVKIAFAREGHARARTIHVSLTPETGAQPSSASSAASANPPEPNDGKDFAGGPRRTVMDPADDPENPDGAGRIATVRLNPLKLIEVTGAADADATLAPQSAQKQIDALGWKARL